MRASLPPLVTIRSSLQGNVEVFVVGTHGVAEVIVSLGGCVGDHFLGKSPDSFKKGRRCLDIRLTYVEGIDLFTLCPCFFGVGQQPTDGRRLERADSFGKLHLYYPLVKNGWTFDENDIINSNGFCRKKRVLPTNLQKMLPGGGLFL